MALVESGLRGFQQESRRGSCEVCVLQFLLGRSIEGNGAERLRARPAVLRGNRYRFIERTKRGRRRNFLKKLRGVLFTGAQLGKARRCRVAEIGFGEAI